MDDDLERNRAARIPRVKPPKKGLRRVSPKTQAKLDEEKKVLSADGDTLLQQFFKRHRKDLTGTCQCGCGEPSQKKDDTYYLYCICHIFPQRLFPSVMYHPLNWVERRFWGGCHTNMDDRSMNLWVNFADWEDIKAKFLVLAPLLTPEEKATKFYTHLEKLVHDN